jgi:hypothetical protein
MGDEQKKLNVNSVSKIQRRFPKEKKIDVKLISLYYRYPVFAKKVTYLKLFSITYNTFAFVYVCVCVCVRVTEAVRQNRTLITI